jgi:hypothetical protein
MRTLTPAEIKIIARIVVACLVLGGCATHPIYTKPGYTPEGFAADKLDCLKQSQVPVVYGGIGGMSNNDALFQTCMEARGWKLRQ